jgi:hypothetical protein
MSSRQWIRRGRPVHREPWHLRAVVTPGRYLRPSASACGLTFMGSDVVTVWATLGLPSESVRCDVCWGAYQALAIMDD